MQITRDTAVANVESLRRTETSSQKVIILRTIKNAVTGQELRKIEYIRAGVLPCIEELVKHLDAEDRDGQLGGEQKQERDTIWLHIASILAVIANAGTACTAPILQTGLTAMLLLELSRTTSSRLRLIILRSLCAIASNRPLSSERGWSVDRTLARSVYTKSNIELITSLITRPCTQIWDQQVKETALALICRTCSSESQKMLMVDVGLLDGLCDQLAQSIVSDQFRNGSVLGYRGASQAMVKILSRFSPTLEAIALIIENSAKHTERFLNHTKMLSALSTATKYISAEEYKFSDSSRLSGNQAFNSITQNHPSSKIDLLLPEVMDIEAIRTAQRSSFPPLDVVNQCTRRRGNIKYTTSGHTNERLPPDRYATSAESLVVPWLIYLTRSSTKRKRIIAARTLVILKHHNLIQPARVRSFAALLVPVLVEILDTVHDVGPNFTQDVSVNSLHGVPYWYLAPSILAMLLRNHEDLQKAAVECKAISKLVTALKTNLELLPDKSLDVWWPYKLREKITEGETASCLGLGGPSEHFRFLMYLREGLLQALAALCSDNDKFRKDVCDQGALSSIILTLEPFHTQIKQGKTADQIVSHGNSPEVLVAACGAIRALSRSPTTLRTKLVDADISKVILKLLYTNDPEVRISATMVLANLSHDFSPMKQNVSDSGVVRKLCEQAHSANARLRHESLFTLKALVTNSSHKLKKLIVDELGCSWIRYLIATDPHDVPQGEVIGLVQRDFKKGSMARFLSKEQDHVMEGTELPSADFDPSEIEAYNSHTLEQDLDIQAEMLAFLRNLTTGESTVEIIDYLYGEIGQEDLMQAIIDRLRDRIQTSPHVTGQLRRFPLVPAATVINTLYLIAHIAASDRRYRMRVCNNTPLMRQVSTLFNSDDAGVRSACCWVVINLIYPLSAVSGPDGSASNDSVNAVMARARELQRLGIRNVIKRMEKTEKVVDVRERAVTAAECFGKLLDRG